MNPRRKIRLRIKIVSAYELKEEVRALFSEYTEMLIKNDESFKKYLDIQNYDEEIEHLEMKYGMPYGRLYLIFLMKNWQVV